METNNIYYDGKFYYDMNPEIHTVSVVAAKKTLRNIVIPDDVEIEGITYKVNRLADYAFASHKLKSILVGKNVERIGCHAFHDCDNLINVTLGTHLVELAFGAFWGCVNLTCVNFPNSLKSIGSHAFFCCFRLNDIYSDIQDPSHCKIGKFAFGCDDELYQRVYLHVPDNINAYRNRFAWGKFIHIQSKNPNQPQINHIVGQESNFLIDAYGARYSLDLKNLLSVPTHVSSYEIIKGCEIICKEVFKSSLVENVIIPDTVTTIGYFAFADCKNLYTITIPDSVREIGHSTFEGCERLTTVGLPRYIDGLRIHTFRDCKSLKSIFLPSGIQFIDLGAFSGCTSLESIVIPSMAVVESYAFAGCSSLKDVSLPQFAKQEAIGSELFEGCSSLENVFYPYDFIPERMFANCQCLEKIQIGGILTEVEDSAFCCTNLRQVDFLYQVREDFDSFENFWRFSFNPNHEIEFLIPFASELSFKKLYVLAEKNPNIKINIKQNKSM